MKTRLILLALASVLTLLPAAWLQAATTISATNHYAYGANVGWLEGRGDVANGAVIGKYVCSGYLYAANVGWINLGSGAPANGIQYQNLSSGDFGVNQDGRGNLRGCAYGANIGWINFENAGGPKVDLVTGKLSGSVYAANCGWISLSNAVACLQSDTIAAGADTDGDGLADAWEWLNFGTLENSAVGDPDGDGFNQLEEYLAGTDPNDGTSNLRITAFSTLAGGTVANVTWSSVPTRLYRIEQTPDLTAPLWFDSGLGLISPDGATTSRTFAGTYAPTRFYRVRAVRPLAP